MKKNYLILALVAMTSLAQANTCTVLSSVSCYNNSYTCDLTSTLGVGGGQQVTGCSFNFNNCAATSWGGGLLYCNVGGINIGTLTHTSSSWVCALDNNGLNTLNNCISGGNKCDFGISCSGGWNIGDCTANYTCNPVPHSVPDAAATVSLLSLGLAGASLLRRKLA